MSRLINFFLFISLWRPQHSPFLFRLDISDTLCILDNMCPFSLWPFRFVAFSICGRYGLWPFRFVAVSVCGRFGLWPFRFVAVSVLAVSVCGRYDQKPFELPWKLWHGLVIASHIKRCIQTLIHVLMSLTGLCISLYIETWALQLACYCRA